jgi:hypothetical protein
MKQDRTFLIAVMVLCVLALYMAITAVPLALAAYTLWAGSVSVITGTLAAMVFLDAYAKVMADVDGERRMRELAETETSIPLWPNPDGSWTAINPELTGQDRLNAEIALAEKRKAFPKLDDFLIEKEKAL